jgi:lipid-binding SYLF domain-containing protein
MPQFPHATLRRVLRPIAVLSVLTQVLLIAACAAPGQTRDEQRQHIQRTERQVLDDLYRLKPDLRADVARAPGYAVFSNVNVNLLLASASTGYGVAVGKSGERTYMKMGEVGVGLGIGVKDFRALFVFDSPEVMNRFVEHGWSFGGHADAAAKAQDKGVAVGGEVVVDGMRVYQLTESGVALQATLKGTKYWKDSELNFD